jgi:hypothetical protein
MSREAADYHFGGDSAERRAERGQSPLRGAKRRSAASCVSPVTQRKTKRPDIAFCPAADLKGEHEGKAFPLTRAAKRRTTTSGVTAPKGAPRGGRAPYGERSDRSGVRLHPHSSSSLRFHESALE